MRRGGRVLVLVVIAIAVLAIAGVVVLRRVIDPAQYRHLIEERASAVVGREVHLGDVELSLFPRVALRADGVEVAGTPEEGASDLLKADSLRVRAAFLPLLRGRLEVGAATISGAKLHLVRDESGEWNAARLIAQRRAAAAAARGGDAGALPGGGREDGQQAGRGATRQPSRLAIDRLVFSDARITVDDRSVSPPVELVLDPVELALDGLAGGSAFDVQLDTRFGAAPDARLRFAGEAGPLGAAGKPFALRGKSTVDRLPAELLTSLARLGGVDLAAATRRLTPVSGNVEVDAALPERATLRGALDLGQVQIELPGDAKPRRITLDVASRFDVTSERGAELLRIAKLEVDLDRTTLSLDGTIERAAPRARRVDLTVHPARLPVDRLAGFLAVVLPDAPLTFSSPQALDVEARIHGIAGPEQRPGIDGRLRVADARVEPRTMKLPLEHLSADITFSGDTLDAKNFQTVIGETDLRGEVHVDGYSRPRVGFDLASRHANLDQLFGALEHHRGVAAGSSSTAGNGKRGDRGGRGASSGPGNGGGASGAAGREPGDPSGQTSPRADDLLSKVEAKGHLRIEQATWGRIQGSRLDGTLRLENGTASLDPLTADLYAGRFTGRIGTRPGTSPVPFELEGRAQDLRVEQFLAGALGKETRLTGRFSGSLNAKGFAGEWAEVARTLDGQGDMKIEDGVIESFPLLRSVATLSGVLGEDGLAKIAQRLADSSTKFSLLAGEFHLGGGAMRFAPLVLQSTDFTLRGEGAVDLVRSALDGKGAMTFSPELSELMRAEGSRAAELFWTEAQNDDGAREGAGHVSLPLSVRGVLGDPSALVDWQSAARTYAERRVGREVGRQVGKILGRLLGGGPTPTPAPAP